MVFVFGILFLAVGLVLVSTSVSLPWILLGAGCVVFGSIALWFIRTEAKALQGQPIPQANERPFWHVLGALNLLFICALATVEQSWWLLALAIAMALVSLTRMVARVRQARNRRPA